MTDSEIALQFVKNCNGICTKKNVHYLMKLIHKEYGRDCWSANGLDILPENIRKQVIVTMITNALNN